MQANQVLNEFQELGLNMVAGTGTPTLSAKKGTLYIQTDGTTTTTRLYINTDGGTTWASFTASA